MEFMERVSLVRELGVLRKEIPNIKGVHRVKKLRRLNEIRRLLTNEKEYKWTFFRSGVSFGDPDPSDIDSLLKIDLRKAVNIKDEWHQESVRRQFITTSFYSKTFPKQDEEDDALINGNGEVKGESVNKEDKNSIKKFLSYQYKIYGSIKRIAKNIGEKIPKEISKAGTAIKKALDAVVKTVSDAEMESMSVLGEKLMFFGRLKLNNKFRVIRNQDVIPSFYPSTLSQYYTGKPMSHNEANMMKANPKYGQKSSYLEDGETFKYSYGMNCTLCVLAYEMRRRGYQVEARSMRWNSRINAGNVKASETEPMVMQCFTMPWIDPATKRMASTTIVRAKNKTQAIEWFNKNLVINARYIISISWRTQSVGHVAMIYKNESGEVTLYDPQNGKSYQGDSLVDYLDSVKFPPFSKYSTERLEVLRCDNLLVDENLVRDLLV